MKILNLSSILYAQKSVKTNNVSPQAKKSLNSNVNLMDNLSCLANLNKTNVSNVSFKSSLYTSGRDCVSKTEVLDHFLKRDYPESLLKRVLQEYPDVISYKDYREIFSAVVSYGVFAAEFLDEESTKEYSAAHINFLCSTENEITRKLIVEDVMALDEKIMKEKIGELWVIMDGEKPSEELVRTVYSNSRLSEFAQITGMNPNKIYVNINGRKEEVIYINGISGLTSGGHWIVFEKPVDWSEPKKEITCEDITEKLIEEKIREIAQNPYSSNHFKYFYREPVYTPPVLEPSVSKPLLHHTRTSRNKNSHVSV